MTTMIAPNRVGTCADCGGEYDLEPHTGTLPPHMVAGYARRRPACTGGGTAPSATRPATWAPEGPVWLP